MSVEGRWGDLAARVASGVVLAVVGFGALAAGGMWLNALAVVAAGAMIWELARITAPDSPGAARLMGLAAAAVLATVLLRHDPFWLIYLTVPSVLGLLWPRRDRIVFAVYAFVLMLACYGVVALRGGLGPGWILWLALLVAAVDILGYFGGRIVGGPKFWPRVSPKKTWSGTVCGWAGAAAVGAGFWAAGMAPSWIVALSPLVGFASQMGDIAESAVKRRSGIKDASNLIPGHGGVMDRFDGLSGAIVFLLLWAQALPLPQIGG